MKEQVKIYFGAPLFTDMERDFNTKVVGMIRESLGDKVLVKLPQENEAINDKSGYADSIMIATADTQDLLDSDYMIAVLDGVTIDAGLASEIGVAYQAGIPIIGLYTDVRQGTYGNKEKINALDDIAESQFSYINLYTVGLIKKNGVILNNVNTLVDFVISEVEKTLDV